MNILHTRSEDGYASVLTFVGGESVFFNLDIRAPKETMDGISKMNLEMEHDWSEIIQVTREVKYIKA